MRERGTIIFDLDGTLVDSAPDLADALDTLLAGRGHAPLGLDPTRQLIGHGVAGRVRKGLQARGETLDAPSLSSAVQGFLGHYTRNLSRRRYPYPYTVQTLTDLAANGWCLVVCTNKLEASARKLLSDHGLLRFFALVAGPDTIGVAKPDPAHLLHCLPDRWPGHHDRRQRAGYPRRQSRACAGDRHSMGLCAAPGRRYGPGCCCSVDAGYPRFGGTVGPCTAANVSGVTHEGRWLPYISPRRPS
jgi:phosphoglycolate phosphatase-like HAD superfamily hydrolase